MRKQKYKGRCEKRILSKSDEVCRFYSDLQSKYADKLDSDNGIKQIHCNVYLCNEGHIFVKLVNRGDKSVHINLGDAFAQGIFMEYGITEDDRVEATRNGGFGSTDKNK